MFMLPLLVDASQLLLPGSDVGDVGVAELGLLTNQGQ